MNPSVNRRFLYNLQKVFPEAAAAAREGKDQDPNLEFPSDDSDDDDYDPDGPGTVEKVGRDESSSDESEYVSACEELEGEASPKDEQQFGLSSDDSEDNDYDPDAPDLNENAKQESSSSDFTSDSEDLVFTLDDGQFSEKDDVNMSSSLDPKTPLGKSQSSKCGGNKSSIKEELLEILDSGTGHDVSPPISGKRNVERLDYKRLHDVSIISFYFLLCMYHCFQLRVGKPLIVGLAYPRMLAVLYNVFQFIFLIVINVIC